MYHYDSTSTTNPIRNILLISDYSRKILAHFFSLFLLIVFFTIELHFVPYEKRQKTRSKPLSDQNNNNNNNQPKPSTGPLEASAKLRPKQRFE